MRRLTTEQYIQKAKSIHGKLYSYEQVIYTHSQDNVDIICNEHGVFTQKAYNHLSGGGCPDCAIENRRVGIEAFIKRSNNIHKNKYDYSLVRYINTTTKVKIICPIHGEFLQAPAQHLNGSECKECSKANTSRKRSLGLEKFISVSDKIHNGKYDYKKSTYVNSKTKVKIICPVHGDFYQAAGHHMRGHGCSACGLKTNSGKYKRSTSGFIIEADKIHNNKYSYQKSTYLGLLTPVTIICPVHGEFEQKPREHLDGNGCQKCSGKLKLTTKEFIRRATKIYGNRYIYNATKYSSLHSKVTITCREHGNYKVVASSHINSKAGCPECSDTRKLTTNRFIEKAKSLYGEKYDYRDVIYSGNKNKVKIHCKKHGIFYQIPNDHLSGHACRECGVDNVRKTTKQWLKKAIATHGSTYDYSDTKYISSTTALNIRCKKHGVFKQNPIDHYRGAGCQKCLSYKGEKEIENELIRLNVAFKTQYSFEDCRYKLPLRFDFYINYNDKQACIEFQGKQHYEVIEFFGGKEGFNETIARDKVKVNYCRSNNIPLLHISYSQFEDIAITLGKFLKTEKILLDSTKG